MAASVAKRLSLPESLRARLPRRPPALLSRQDAGLKPMPLLIGVLVYFGLLALLSVVTVDRLAGSWRDDLESGMTLMLPASASDQAQRLAGQLTSQHGVAAAEVLLPEAVRTELQPWLGNGSLPEGIPLPVVIAIEMGDSTTKPEVLQAQLQAEVPGARLVDNRLWLDDAARIATVAQTLALLGVALVGGCLALVIFAVTRLLFAINSSDVRILHLAGATDTYISRQFERLVLRVTIAGVALGLLLTGMTLWLLDAGLADLAGAELFTGVRFGWPERIVMIATPALLLFAARHVSRRTVSRSLRELPA